MILGLRCAHRAFKKATRRCSAAFGLPLLVACEDVSLTRRASDSGYAYQPPAAAERPTDRAFLEALARAAAERENLDPALVFAVIEVESGWNPHAVSEKGALGLMQLLPATARERFGVREASQLLDPQLNLSYGTEHLRGLLERFCDVWLALWAWHAGAERVDPAAASISPPESERFVRAVLARYEVRRAEEPAGHPAASYPRADCAGAPAGARIASLAPSVSSAPPVAEITHAWITTLSARVGEPIDLRLVAVNRGGPARRGTLVAHLLEYPRLRLGYTSDLIAARRDAVRDRSSAAAGRVRVEATTEAWAPGAEHWLLLRLVPQETGEITLTYGAVLEGGLGEVSTSPPASSIRDPLGRPAKLVRITVTPTLAWRER